MWQAATFDPAIIDQELGWAEDLGFNAVRVFLHYLLWEQDSGGFLRRLERFLEIADRHHIGTMFVLFDDCWSPKFALGPQPAPRPGVHNSGWVQCPGPDLLQSPDRWGVLEDYTRGVVGFLRGDRRVLAWDLYNEPGNSDYGAKSLPLVKRVFAWARAAAPSQPLTVGIWDESKELAELNAVPGRTLRHHLLPLLPEPGGRRKAGRRAQGLRPPAHLHGVHGPDGRQPVRGDPAALQGRGRRGDELGLRQGQDPDDLPLGLEGGRAGAVKSGSTTSCARTGPPIAMTEAALIRRMAGKSRPDDAGNAAAVAEPFHGWALTPPLGWNSWDSFGQAVTEDEVKANADFMAARLAELGWRYVVVDIEWSEPQRLGPDYPVRSKSEVDAFGRFVPAASRFPSSAGGRGFKPLADYVHRKGLKFGVHIVRGIPRLAVERNTPIEGIALPGRRRRRQGGFLRLERGPMGRRRQEARGPGLVRLPLPPARGVGGRFRQGRRPLLPRRGDRHAAPGHRPDGPAHRAEPVLRADAARRGPRRSSRTPTRGACSATSGIIGTRSCPPSGGSTIGPRMPGPGHWPEPDMLPLGHLRFLPEGWSKNVTRNPGYFAMASHGGREDVPNFLSRDEQRTVMTLWAISRSQMMFGGHLPASDAWTLSLITNPGVLAVNQRSRMNRQLFHANGLAAWTADDPSSGARYVAVFNVSDREEKGPEAGIAVPVRLADMGLAGPVAVTDVWSGRPVGVVNGEFAPVVPYHGAGLFRLQQAKR